MHAVQANQAATGAKILVTKEEFIRLVKAAESSTVVYIPSRWYTMVHTYMLNRNGLYIVARTKEELPIPRHIEVITATAIYGMM